MNEEEFIPIPTRSEKFSKNIDMLALLDDEDLTKQLAQDSYMEFLDQAPSMQEVNCEQSARQALCYSLQARKLKNQIETSRKEIVRPHIDFQKAVMKIANDFNDKLGLIETSLQVKITDWMKEQKDNPFTYIDEIEVEDGKISLKQNWDFEIEDPTSVPPQFLKPDEDTIKRAIASGLRKIPGVKIFSYESTQMRVKN